MLSHSTQDTATGYFCKQAIWCIARNKMTFYIGCYALQSPPRRKTLPVPIFTQVRNASPQAARHAGFWTAAEAAKHESADAFSDRWKYSPRMKIVEVSSAKTSKLRELTQALVGEGVWSLHHPRENWICWSFFCACKVKQWTGSSAGSDAWRCACSSDHRVVILCNRTRSVIELAKCKKNLPPHSNAGERWRTQKNRWG